jgi:CspA family cold shock protein
MQPVRDTDRVEFEVQQGKKGLNAVNVRIVQ